MTKEDREQKKTEWQKFTGDYKKVHYDIRKKSSNFIIMIENCWPNAGGFHTPDGDFIKGEDVAEIRETSEANEKIRSVMEGPDL